MRPTFRQSLIAIAFVMGCGFQPLVVDPLPRSIEQLQAAQGVTIVAFVNVECEYSRRLYRNLGELPEATQVTVVPRYVPLRSRSVPTLRALVCAAEQGHDYTDRLMNESDRSAQYVATLASRDGLDLDELNRCAEAEASVTRIRSDVGLAECLRVSGLPTFFVGNERFQGVPSTADIEASIQRAVDR